MSHSPEYTAKLILWLMESKYHWGIKDEDREEMELDVSNLIYESEDD